MDICFQLFGCTLSRLSYRPLGMNIALRIGNIFWEFFFIAIIVTPPFWPIGDIFCNCFSFGLLPLFCKFHHQGILFLIKNDIFANNLTIILKEYYSKSIRGYTLSWLKLNCFLHHLDREEGFQPSYVFLI